MVLTAENYYGQEANEEYMSVSQFKDFCGTYGKLPCEFTAVEKLNGYCCARMEWTRNRKDYCSGRKRRSCKRNAPESSI